MSAVFDFILHTSTIIILIYFFMINTFYLLLMLLSMLGIHHYRELTAFISLKDIFQSPLTKPISVITPAFNEEKNIIESVKSLLSLEYPRFEVIVVNDGSTDATLERLIDTFGLKKTNRVFKKSIQTKMVKGIYASPSYPNLTIIDKINGKKADALNAGLNVARFPLFCSIDSDSILEKDSLLKISRPFLLNPGKVVGAGGVIRLSNGCRIRAGEVKKIAMPKNSLARFQIIEYLRAFLGGRMGLSMLKSILILSGAFAAFRKDIVLKCGGYRTDTVCEDMDLVIRIQKYLHENKLPLRFYFIPDPICWTEAPETFRGLARQRNRWHRGLIESLFHSFKMFLNPRYKITGLIAMPYYVIFEMCGPLIEFLGYLILSYSMITSRINYPFAFIFFLLAVLYGITISLSSILLEEYSLRRYPRISDVFVLFFYGLLENIFYRQFITGVRVKAFFDFLFGKKEWGSMKRKGFIQEKEIPNVL